MQQPTCGIYAITGPGGVVYIGSSEDIPRRWKSHRALLNGKRHHNYLLQAAWTEAGEAAFAFTVIAEVTEADLIAAEQRHLDTAKATGPVYNLAMDIRSPARGLVHTEAARLKMSIAIKASLTPEALAARSARLKGDGNPMSKLDTAMVLAIVGRLLGGDHPMQVAADLGVVQETVYQIRSGRTWQSVVSPETVAAMLAIKQKPRLDVAVTEQRREHMAAVGRSNKGKSPSDVRRRQISEQSRGAGNPKAKLDEAKVREIKRRQAAGVPDMKSQDIALAAEFGVSFGAVNKIRYGQTWTHVTID